MRRTVKQGECLSSIAYEGGFSWNTLWNHPENAALRRLRKNPHILFPGDEVFIPEKRERSESVATGQRHRFVAMGVPERLHLVLKKMGRPRANEPFTLIIDGRSFNGKTDASGTVDVAIAPNAAKAKLTIGAGDDLQVFELQLGHLDPVIEVSGAQARLNNLGFGCGAVDGILGPRTRNAIRAFQDKCGLAATGDLDEATRNKLVAEYGA
jgi:hypothetical protein